MCIDDGKANTGCVMNTCTNSNNPLGHSYFCGNTEDLCEIGSVCFNGVCTTPTTNPETSSSTPEEESITKKFVKTVVKTFLVGLTIALPLGLVLYLMFKL